MNVFVELTNRVHGGEGWELGEVLWSPVASSWNNIMTRPQQGDLVIHSLKGSKPHRFTGYSFVAAGARRVSQEPPIPGKWQNHSEYYQISLVQYTEFNEKKSLIDFYSLYKEQLNLIMPQQSFYTESGSEIKTAQKYLASVSPELFILVKEYLNLDIVEEDNGEIKLVSRPGDVEDVETNGEDGSPSRVKTIVNRIIRDTNKVRELKDLYNDTCQISGERIKLPSGKYYSEGHHLKKLGGSHQGPDEKSNIILLSPNHHVEFDYGIIGIDPTDLTIKHIDPEHPLNGKSLAYKRNDLGIEYIKYHWNYIFNK